MLWLSQFLHSYVRTNLKICSTGGLVAFSPDLENKAQISEVNKVVQSLYAMRTLSLLNFQDRSKQMCTEQVTVLGKPVLYRPPIESLANWTGLNSRSIQAQNVQFLGSTF